MQRTLNFQRLSEEEEVKRGGLTLDFDEIARKGALSGEEKNIAKWYGIYNSRQPGNHMARVVIPGGVMTATQARCIAKTAYLYGQGKLNVTTRQAIQFHWLKVGALADMLRELKKGHLSTKHGCGDVTRNVAACPMAETCRYRRHNVRPVAIHTAIELTDSEDLDNLPRKFKITYSGCPTACGQPYMNCVGAIAVIKKEGDDLVNGYKVVIGGGMGWKAFVAQELFSYVPESQMVPVARAIALLYRDHGDRFNRAKSRLKFVVHRLGIAQCREIVLQNLKKEGHNADAIYLDPIEDAGGDYPERLNGDAEFLGTDGLATVGVRVPKGECTYQQMNELAKLSEEFGDQRVYTTNRQNFELKGVAPVQVETLKKRITAIGLEPNYFNGLIDMVTCVGTTYCPKAVAETRKLFDILQPLARQEKYSSIERSALINITGCPNSCSPYRITDIGFRGMRIREELGSIEGYEMLIGGSQTLHGQKLGDFKTTDLKEVTEAVLDHFIQIRHVQETLTACVNRVGIEVFKKVVFEEDQQ